MTESTDPKPQKQYKTVLRKLANDPKHIEKQDLRKEWRTGMWKRSDESRDELARLDLLYWTYMLEIAEHEFEYRRHHDKGWFGMMAWMHFHSYRIKQPVAPKLHEYYFDTPWGDHEEYYAIMGEDDRVGVYDEAYGEWRYPDYSDRHVMYAIERKRALKYIAWAKYRLNPANKVFPVPDPYTPWPPPRFYKVPQITYEDEQKLLAESETRSIAHEEPERLAPPLKRLSPPKKGK